MNENEIKQLFMDSFKQFIENFNKENNVIVSLRLPIFQQEILERHEIPARDGITLVPTVVFVEKTEQT